ncbi:MAG: hypothetical protein U0235_24050 [Polyangiaceae bacterium]
MSGINSRAFAVAALVGLMAVGCDRNTSGGRTDKVLVGTWRERGGQEREYVLRDDGSFSMRMTATKCVDAAATDTTTTSGTWSSQDGTLVLVVKTSSDPIFEGSTMKDTIRTVDATTLVLESSVLACGGREVRLSKQ